MGAHRISWISVIGIGAMKRFLVGAQLLLVSSSVVLASSWVEEDAAVKSCFAAMDRDPLLQNVNAKFARREPSPGQLADASVPTAEEQDQLRLRIRKTRPCREMRLAAVQIHRPALKPAYAILYYQSDQVFDYLGQRFISYGTANRLAGEALNAFRQRELAYLSATDDGARRALAAAWEESLQRAHSYPPPDSGPRVCGWADLNVVCD